MAASWLKNYLAPIRFLVAGIAQLRDDRVNFRNGFTASQVADADGINVLTIDTAISNTQYEPIPSTIPIRNASGTLKGNVITSTSFTYVTPVTIQYDEPFQSNHTIESTDWAWNFSRVPATTVATAATWACDLNLIPGSTLKTVSVVYTPPSGHGALPLTTDRTRVLLISYEDDGTATAIADVYDNPASVVAYEVNRTLTLDLGAGITVVTGRRYVFLFVSEGGANALSGTILYRQARWTAQVSAPRS
jgi:hypothetical protein